MAELICSSWTNKFFVILLLSKTPPPSARSPRRWPLRHNHRSRSHQTVLPLQLRLPERNHQKTGDYQSVRRDQRVSRSSGTRAGAIRHARGQRCIPFTLLSPSPAAMQTPQAKCRKLFLHLYGLFHQKAATLPEISLAFELSDIYMELLL